jgi:hypothetical protein
MPRPPLPTPGRSSGTCEAAHLLVLLVTIPRLWSRAYLLRGERYRSQIVDVGLTAAQLHDKRSRGCRMHKCCASREYGGLRNLGSAVVGCRPVDTVPPADVPPLGGSGEHTEQESDGESLSHLQRLPCVKSFLSEPSSFTTATSSDFLLPPV